MGLSCHVDILLEQSAGLSGRYCGTTRLMESTRSVFGLALTILCFSAMISVCKARPGCQSVSFKSLVWHPFVFHGSRERASAEKQRTVLLGVYLAARERRLSAWLECTSPRFTKAVCLQEVPYATWCPMQLFDRVIGTQQEVRP